MGSAGTVRLPQPTVQADTAGAWALPSAIDGGDWWAEVAYVRGGRDAERGRHLQALPLPVGQRRMPGRGVDRIAY